MALVEIEVVVERVGPHGAIFAVDGADVEVQKSDGSAVTVWTTSAGTVAATLPLKSRNGRVDGWVEDGQLLRYRATKPGELADNQPWAYFVTGGRGPAGPPGPDTALALSQHDTSATAHGRIAVLRDAPINVKSPPGALAPVVGDGVADDTAAMQAIINSLPNAPPRKGGTILIPAGVTIAHTGTLDASQTSGVTIEGHGTGNGIYNTSRLLYKGSGARGIDGRSSNGLTFRNLDVRYDNPAFTGILLDFDHDLPTAVDAAFMTFEGCRVGSAVQEGGGVLSAQCLVSLNNAIFFRSIDTYYQGAQRGIRGADPARPGYSNGHLIRGGCMDHLPVYAIGNLDQGCQIVGVGFEGIEVVAGGALYTILGDDSGIARVWHGISLEGGWVGDIGIHATKALIDLPSNVTTRGLHIGGGIFLTTYQGINHGIRLRGPSYGLSVQGCEIGAMPHFDFGTAQHVGGKVSGCTFAGGGAPTTTTAAVAAGATTVPVVSTAGFASAGRAFGSANSATFDYTGKTATSFTGVTNLKLPIASGAGISQGGLTIFGWHNGHRGVTFEDNHDAVGLARSKVMRNGHQIAQRTPGEIPTIAVQAAAGTGASASLSAASNDVCGRITLTTGTGVTANGLHAIVTFGDAFNNEGGGATAPVVMLQGRDATTAQWNSAVGAAMGSFRIDGVGLAASTTYTIDYYVIQPMA